MKKSDIAIYISAILTLVLTTAIVFSTQRVSYENKLDDLLHDKAAETNHLAMATDPNTGSDLQSPLFRNRLPDESSDIKKTPDKSESRDEDASAAEKDLSIKSQNEKAAAVAKPLPTAKKEAIFDDEAQDKIIGKPLTADKAPAIIPPKLTEPQKAQIPESKANSFKPETASAKNDKVSSPLTKPETASVKNDKASSPLAKPEAAPVKSDKAPVAKTEPVSVKPETKSVMAADKVSSPSVKQEPVTPKSDTTITNAKSDRVHIVQSGDMLRTIAARYGTTTMKLIQLNNFQNPDLIYPGQAVRLP